MWHRIRPEPLKQESQMPTLKFSLFFPPKGSVIEVMHCAIHCTVWSTPVFFFTTSLLALSPLFLSRAPVIGRFSYGRDVISRSRKCISGALRGFNQGEPRNLYSVSCLKTQKA